MASRFAGVLTLVSFAVFALGCGGANRNKYLRRQASQDLQCSEGQVRLSAISRGNAQYLAEACGRRAVYTYTRQQGPMRVSAIEGANVPVVMPPPGPGGEIPPPPPPLPPAL